MEPKFKIGDTVKFESRNRAGDDHGTVVGIGIEYTIEWAEDSRRLIHVHEKDVQLSPLPNKCEIMLEKMKSGETQVPPPVIELFQELINENKRLQKIAIEPPFGTIGDSVPGWMINGQFIGRPIATAVGAELNTSPVEPTQTSSKLN